MKPPDFYIVPSKVVANYVRTSHRKWLNLPKKNGQTRMDSSIRKFNDPKKKYIDKWELLGLKAQHYDNKTCL